MFWIIAITRLMGMKIFNLGILVVQIQLVKYLFYILAQGAGTHNVYPWIVFLDTIKVEGQGHELAVAKWTVCEVHGLRMQRMFLVLHRIEDFAVGATKFLTAHTIHIVGI